MCIVAHGDSWHGFLNFLPPYEGRKSQALPVDRDYFRVQKGAVVYSH